MRKVVVTSDSEWDEEQVALLLASRELRSDVGEHGQPMSEAMSPLADPNRRDGWRYVARLRRDHAAAEIAQARKARADAYPDADLSADVWTVEKHWND